MATIKYDATDVEPGGGGNEPQPDLYQNCKLVGARVRDAKANGQPTNDVELIFDLGPEYLRKWWYIQPEVKWKWREMTDALGLPPKGEISDAKLKALVTAGTFVDIRIKGGVHQDGTSYRGEIKNVYKAGASGVDASEATQLADAAAGDVDYTTWSKEDLLAEIDERGLTKPSGRVTEQKLIDVLLEADAAGSEDTPEGGNEPTGDHNEFDIATVDGYESFADWSNDDLKEELNTLGIKLEGRFSEGKAREAIIAHHNPVQEAAAEEGEAGPPSDEPAPDEYETFTDQDLKDEIADRVKDGIEIAVAGRWTRDKAIKTLREDDANTPF